MTYSFRSVARLTVVLLLLSVLGGGHVAQGQQVRIEFGGGWAIPSSSVDMRGTVQGGPQGTVTMNPGSDRHVYGSAGLIWTLSSNFSLGGRLRVQQSWLRGDASDLTSTLGCEDGECRVSNDPDGQLWAASIEGRLILTSVGRIKPYFLVGLGVVRTSIDGTTVSVPVDGQSDDAEVDFDDVRVTDAGGDVGFGAMMGIVGDLSLTAEIRATGSLPGAKDNAITTFPFSLGLMYEL